MSRVDEIQVHVQSILSAFAALEQTAGQQAGQVESLTARVTTLAAENAALRERLAGSTDTGEGAPADDTGAPAATQWGFVANETDPLAGLKVALPRVAADGGTWLRLWHSGFGPIKAATATLVDLAVANGTRVILCVQPKDTRPYSLGTPDFTAFASTNAAVLKRVAFVEAGNELNLLQYRPDDLGTDATWPGAYVRRWLKPMCLALEAIGVKTMCTSITETLHPERYAPQYAALLNAGAADWCSAVALHAYALPQFLPDVAAAVGLIRQNWKKPVHVTECNVYTRGLARIDWATQLPPYLLTLKTAGVASVCFYRGFAKPGGKWSWPVLFEPAGGVTEAYSVLVAEMKK